VNPPIFRPAAAADIEDAYRWYEAQQIGLGDEFPTALQAIIESQNDSLSFTAKLVAHF
jgi:hypothetical protein